MSARTLAMLRVTPALGWISMGLAAITGLVALSLKRTGDPILEVDSFTINTMRLTSASTIQKVRPTILQRGVRLEGTIALPSLQGMQFAGSPFEVARGTDRLASVSLVTGSPVVEDIDIALPSTGIPITIGRTFNSVQLSGGSHSDSDGIQGKNWFQVSMPEIMLYDDADNTKDRLYLIYGADRFIEFRRVGSSSNTFRATNGANGLAQYAAASGGEPEKYTVTDSTGRQWTFFGFDSNAGNAKGQLWKATDLAGNVTFNGNATTASTAISSGFDGSGRLTKAYDATDRRFTYTYASIGGASRLTQVKAETKASGTWASPSGVSEVARVDYDYYSADADAHGDAGDLKTATVTMPLADAGISIETNRYYRYWEGTYNSSTNPGYPHCIKLVLAPEGARQQDWQDYALNASYLTEPDDDNLKPFADRYLEFNSNYQARTTWSNGQCGCSGAGSGIYGLTYETNSVLTNVNAYDVGPLYRVIVNEPTGRGFTTYVMDELGQPLSEIHSDIIPTSSSPAPKKWIKHLNRTGSGIVDTVYSPSSINSYTHSSWTITLKSSSGSIVDVSDREVSGESTGYLLSEKRQIGTGGTPETIRGRTYSMVSLTPVGYDAPLNVPSVATDSVYETLGGSAVTTSYTHYFYSGTTPEFKAIALEELVKTFPVVSSGKNGSNSADSNAVHFGLDGLIDFEKDETGRIRYRTSSPAGSVFIEDADTSQTGVGQDFYGITIPTTHTSFVTSGSGAVHRRTTAVLDAQGRVSTVSTPGSAGATRTKKQFCSKLANGEGISLTYADYESGATPKYYGPVSFVVTNLAGRASDSGTIALTSNESTMSLSSHVDDTQDNPISAIVVGSISAMVSTIYNRTGSQVTERHSYHTIPGSYPGSGGVNFDVSTFGYDAAGRRIRTLLPSGTIEASTFDANSRIIERWTGTDDSGSGSDNMVKTEMNVYDGGGDMADGLLTQRTLYVEGSTTGQRVTAYLYDSHDNLVVTLNANAPHDVRKVDYLGRITAEGLYSSSSGLSAATDPASTTTNRMGLKETFYDERGRVWKMVQHKIDASDGSDDDTLESLTWYNSEGRVIKVKGREFTKTLYDRLGRTTHQFVLANTDDSVFADADNVSGDVVLEEHQITYDTPTNNVIMQATIQRHSTDFSNNNTHTLGPLDTNADSDRLKFTATNLKGRILITANWYDRFGRLMDSVAYGDNGGSDFDRSGLSAPSSADNTPRTSYSYDTAGRVKDVTDPKGIITRSEYDSEGRKTKEIRNYDDGTPSGDGSGGSPVNDVTTLWVYTNGLLTSMTADLPAGQTDQVTTYTYGTTKGVGAGDSKIATGHLLQKVTYPDDAIGDRGYVLYAYNAQSQLVWTEDQATNVVENVYDTSGRETARKVTTLASGFDGAVRRIERAYDTLGRASTVTQYDAASSGSVTDEVKYSYDDWGNLAKFQQDRNSTVAGSGGDDYAVSYAYAKNTSGRNTLRRSSMTLPSGKQIDFTYSNNRGLLDNDASRVTSEKDGAVVLSTFAYNGVGSVVYTTFPEPQVTSTVRGASAGTYAGIDRFNRITESYWQKDLVSPIKFYDTNISWDRNSNVALITDAVHHGFDVAYTNDDLSRLTKASEGTWSGSAITSKTREQEWTKLSHTGNWTEAKLDLNGDGNYTGTGEYDDTRTNNAVNEMLTRSWGGNTYTAAYNKNGDMTDDGKDYKYEWDAFNRLVRVKNQSNQLVEEYRYNGLGFRIAWHADSDADGDVDSTDKWYFPAYDEAWRIVSVYRESDASPKEEFVAQLAGDDGYGASSLLDGVVVRYKDANTAFTTASDGVLEEKAYYCQNWRGDVSALVSSAGAMIEWVKYSAYGIPFGLPVGDTNSDGDCDSGDSSQISIWYGAVPAIYDVRGDVDLDGDVDTTDQALLSAKSLGFRVQSHVLNRRGFGGYEMSTSIDSFWHVRTRSLDSKLGVWLQRDPLRFVDGTNLLAYVEACPLTEIDPIGLTGQGPESGPTPAPANSRSSSKIKQLIKLNPAEKRVWNTMNTDERDMSILAVIFSIKMERLYGILWGGKTTRAGEFDDGPQSLPQERPQTSEGVELPRDFLDIGGAMRHCVRSCMEEFNSPKGRQLVAAHEPVDAVPGSYDYLDSARDRKNNQIGRACAADGGVLLSGDIPNGCIKCCDFELRSGSLVIYLGQEFIIEQGNPESATSVLQNPRHH